MIVQFRNVSYQYGTEEVLDNISFGLKENDFVALIGPNGAGKTTIAKLITGTLKPQSGEIMLFSESIRSFSSWFFIGYVPQRFSIHEQYPATVEEIIALKKCKHKKEIKRSLSLVGFEKQKFIELSGGQQQRVLIALALMSHPRLLILDEPTVGVDQKTQEDFYKLLKKLHQEEEMTILLVTHDIGAVTKHARTLLCINHKICCSGSVKETETMIEKTYGKGFAPHHHA